MEVAWRAHRLYWAEFSCGGAVMNRYQFNVCTVDFVTLKEYPAAVDPKRFLEMLGHVEGRRYQWLIFLIDVKAEYVTVQMLSRNKDGKTRLIPKRSQEGYMTVRFPDTSLL